MVHHYGSRLTKREGNGLSTGPGRPNWCSLAQHWPVHRKRSIGKD